MLAIKFPQFTRLFAANKFQQVGNWIVRLSLFVFVGALIGSNLVTLRNASSPYKNPNVLGSMTNGTQPESSTAQQLEHEYARWQTIIKQHPDYRDGFYTLSLLAYQLQQIQEAKNYLSVVKKLDPNYPGISQLEALLYKE